MRESKNNICKPAVKAARAFFAAAVICALFGTALFSCSFFNADSPSETGSITMNLPSAEEISAASGGSISGAVTSSGAISDAAVKTFKVRAKSASTGVETVQSVAPGSTVNISPLGPGFWSVTLFGNNEDGQTIYYGKSDGILVSAGRTTPAAVVINPMDPNTPLVATLAETPAGVSLQGQGRENVMGVYVSYSSGGQSGSAYYDFSNAAGSAKQGDDSNKISVPIPAFLEPGSAVSGKVYLFDRGGTALWGGSIEGSVKKDGTFDCAFAFLETALRGYQGSPARTFLKVEEALPAQLETPLAYSFETMAYGAPAGESKSYSDLTIFSAAPSEACGKIPVIVECGSSAWAEVFDAKHKYAEPTVTMPEQKIPLGATRTLSAVVSSSEQKEYSVFRAAQDFDAYGFKLYSIQAKDTGSTVSSSSYAAPASPVSSEFTAPDKVKATGSGSDEYTWQVTVTNSAYSYFDGNETQPSKTFNGTFNVSGSAWTITPASVTVERGAAFALTLSCADATPADAASVTKVTLNATSPKDFVPAVSGTSLVVNAESFATWTSAAPKNVSVLVESVAAGTIEVTATAPSGGGGSGSNPQGMTYGEFVQMPFSIAADKQVYFSPGNLWYQASTSTFKFSERQYDIVGKDANEAAFTAFISDNPTSYTGWTDLFEWGSSGAGRSGIAYPPYTRKFPDGLQDALHVPAMTGQYAELDWGVHNPISNGGNQPGQWRTLTLAEWNYLLHSRSGAPSKRAPARVNGIAGMILFPDTWNPGSMPNGITLNYTNSQNSSDTYGTNTYTALEFSQLEALGAVFLPSTGCCYAVYESATPSWDGYDGSDTSTSNTKYVSYWTATAYSDGSDTKLRIYTSDGGYNKSNIGNSNPSANTPNAVRLIQDRPDYYVVASVNPSQLYVSSSGAESGDGSEASPFATIAQAVAKIKSFAEAQDYTIYIDGNLTTKQTMTDTSLTRAYAKSITVKGKNGINANTGEPNDSITGNGGSSSGPLLTIEMSAPIIIKDLKFKGGYDSLGGGIKIGDGMNNTTYCDVTLGSGVLVTENEAYSLGAGVYASPRSKLTIDGAVISKNEIRSPTNNEGGSGIYFYGYEMVIKGDTKIIENTGSTSSQSCPAVYCPFNSSKNSNCNITIEDNTEISKNEGMGLCLASVIGTLTIRGNAKITENENLSSNDVGGIRLVGNSSGTLNATISGNVQISGNKASTFAGIGVYYAAILNFEGGIISGNEAKTMGGGIGIYSGTVYMSGGEISGNKITNASSTNHGGGGVYIGHRATNLAEGKFYLTGGTIKENTVNSSGRGTGVYVIDTVCTGTNPNKSATFSMGGAAKVDSSNNVYIRRTESTPTIVIASDLTQTGSLATIMLESYSVGTPVLSGTLVKNYYTQFTLSDATYSIDESGALVSN